MEPYWNEANGHVPHSVKYESEAAVSSFPYCTESSLNFSTNATAFSEDDAEYSTGGRRNKTSRQDPLSHRIIEKRRRDRMNSCLADLSRLIPPQYQRKGRGRIEKTEIIEMAIRHLRHLQGECMQKENEYRLGYTDCMKETAKFLYDSQMQEFCYRLLARLQEHCDEVMKSECFRQRGCHAVSDNVSASSGSPHHGYHGSSALCHLRDILPISDIEHSNDHNDVKDLSFRNHLHQLQRPGIVSAVHEPHNHHTHHHINENINNGSAVGHRNGIISQTETKSPSNVICSTNGNTEKSLNCKNILNSSDDVESIAQLPHQAPIITSTATPSTLQHHTDSSNHDFDSSGEPMSHADTSTMHSPPPRSTLLPHGNHHQQSQHNHLDHRHHHHHHHHDHDQQRDSPINHNSDSLLMQERLRNFSELSHDVEHNNNYKYKNHIKERFNHELHDEETSSEHCLAPPMLQSEHSHSHSEHSKDGTEPEIAPIIAKKRKLAEAAAAAVAAVAAASVAGDSNIPLTQNDSNISTNSDLNTNDMRLRMARHLTTTAIKVTPNSLNPIIMAKEEKCFGAFGDIKAETSSSSSGINVTTNTTKSTLLNVPSSTRSTRNFPVPIFALHSQGAYYVPLTVDYNALLPYLNGVDLLQRNYPTMPTLHPINVNVNFTPSIVTTVTVCKE